MRWTAILVGTAVALTACGHRDREEVAQAHARVDEHGRVVLTSEERVALGLETVPVEQGVLTTSSVRYGRVVGRPQEDALVTAPMTGRLVAPPVALGASVTAGDVLVALEPLVDTASRATIEAQRRELDGQVESASAQVEAKIADLRRVTTLVSSGLATDADRAQAEANLMSERARVASLRRASGDLARMTGGRIELRAPVAGIVAILATEVGALVQQGSILARIVRVGPRWIDVALPPGDVVGSGYRVRGPSGTTPATLQFRGVVIQSDGTRRDRLEVAADAAADLPPGATVPVDVLRDTQGRIVPRTALVRRGRDTLLFVEIESNRYEARPVQVAAQDDTHAVLTSGVVPGDRVVVRGASALLGEIGAARAGATQ